MHKGLVRFTTCVAVLALCSFALVATVSDAAARPTTTMNIKDAPGVAGGLPGSCSIWHELSPNFCQYWHQISYIDMDLSTTITVGDSIRFSDNTPPDSTFRINAVTPSGSGYTISIGPGENPSIPTLSEWGMLLLLLVIVGLGLFVLRRKHQSART